MRPGKGDRGLIGGDRNTEITERIKRDGRSDKLRGGRIKDRIGLVQDTIESRDRHLLSGLDVLQLTVAEGGVVTPASVKQFITFKADGAEPGIGFIVEQTVSEFSQTRTGAARYNLLERIKRIECIRRNTSLRVGWRVRRFRTRRNRRLRGNG